MMLKTFPAKVGLKKQFTVYLSVFVLTLKVHTALITEGSYLHQTHHAGVPC